MCTVHHLNKATDQPIRELIPAMKKVVILREITLECKNETFQKHIDQLSNILGSCLTQKHTTALIVHTCTCSLM